MANTLNTTVSQQASTTTDNPQPVGQSTSINNQTKNTQSLASQSALDNTSNVQGIPLINTQPNVVTLSSSTAKVSVTPAPKPKPHHINPIAGGIVILLIVLAVAYVISINRSAKKTTD
ncbi:MAG TPA: hypothetical protein VIH90_07595 [Candidatus Saccharimonadales bacterium]